MKSQTWAAVAALFSAVSVGLVGAVLGVVLDRPTSTSVDREQTALLRELLKGNEHFAAHLDTLEEDVAGVKKAVGKLTLGPGALAPASAVDKLPAPPPGEVTVKLAQTYKRMPGGEFRFFHPAPGLKLLDTKSYPAGAEVATGEPFKDGILFLKPGEATLVQVTWKNPAEKGQSFFVVPHLVEPSEYQSATPWKCMCTGEMFVVPPRGTWSRVMSIEVTGDVPAGAKLIGTHDVVGPMQASSS